jgi:hypothetical protein
MWYSVVVSVLQQIVAAVSWLWLMCGSCRDQLGDGIRDAGNIVDAQ